MYINVKTKMIYSFDVNTLITDVLLRKTIYILCDYVSFNNHSLPFLVENLKDHLFFL